MISRLIAFTMLISVPTFAADDCNQTTIDQTVIRNLTTVSSRLNVECPNQLDVPNFCAAVEMQSTEMNPSHPSIQYQYQTMIFSASCVVNSDSDDVIKAKVQNFWNKYHDRLLCNQFNFNPRNGNILKLAVAKQSGRFIADAVSRWQISLNHVDDADHLTVLDYIEQRRASAGENTPYGRTLKRYYDQFKAAGAKHSREL